MTDDQDEHALIAQRREKLRKLREGGVAFPNDFRRDALAAALHADYDGKSAEALEAQPIRVKVAGRMMAKRVMGKSSFTEVQDMTGRIQLFLQRDALPEGVYASFKGWDVGDIVAAEGVLFKTKTGELSVKIDDLRLMTKSLRPLPEKFHGLTDQETRYRQRYLDLIMSEESRNVFILRSRIVQYLRDFLNRRGFLEVETPMMQVIPGGATARPFVTYHNALDMSLFLRIAPELYLKRLVVGGFEKVYEINRNFRNEGLSTRHNPEFTMLEFYEAYADYQDLMDTTETLLRSLALDLLGTSAIHYQGESYDFGKAFARMTVKESILNFNPRLEAAQLDDPDQARAVARSLDIPLLDGYGLGKVQIEIFEKTVEHRLKDSDVHHRLSDRSVAARAPQRCRSVRHRPLRVLRRRPRDRQWIFRVERSGGSGRALSPAGGGQGGRRRGGDALRRGLRLRPRARHAADRGRGHRHRSPGDAVYRLGFDSRRAAVSAHAPVDAPERLISAVSC